MTPPSEAPRAPDPEPEDARQDRRARRDQLRHALSTRLLTTFAVMLTIVTGLVFVIASYLIHHTTNRALERELARRLEVIAALSARTLDDPTYLPVGLTGRTDRAGELARRWLAEQAEGLRAATGVSHVILFRPAAGDATEIDVIAAAPAVERDRVLGPLLADGVAIAEAQATGKPASSTLYWDPVSGDPSKCAYAPILRGGRAAAVVGVELPADYLVAADEVKKRIWFLGGLAGLTVLSAAVFLVRHRVHNPIYRLVRAMQGEDGVPQRARVRWNDEIGVLTECYNAMVDRLGENERELRELYGRAREQAVYLQGYSSSLVAGVPSGVVAIDPKGVVTVWNERATSILGVRGAVGRPAAEQLEPDHPLRRAFEGALRGSVTDQALVVLDLPPGGPRDPSSDEARALPPDADAADAADAEDDEAREPAEERQRMVELTCAAFHGEKGELLGAAALVNDRTELEGFRRSASRNERLAAIGTLGAGLAHEIKNPLGAISGFAELIERKEGLDAARLAGRLRREVDELNRFLGEFLSFARDDTIRREPHDLADLLRRGVSSALQGVGVDVAHLEAALDGEPIVLPGGARARVHLVLHDLPTVAVDGALLRSAFANLAKNALQAMAPRGGGELTVRATRFEDVVFVRFRDQGPGIPLELRERIFDPLFTTRAEGTGLGLAITHKTVTAHGGKISVRDAPGGGAELVVRLPVVAAATPAPAGAGG